MKKAVLLVNVGTPDSPHVSDVRKYLREFLSDPRVLDIPYLLRLFLVHVIIAPFRGPKSAHEYQKLWTEKGSPLLYHTKSLVQKLQTQLGPDYDVFLAMRYQSPSLKQTLEQIHLKNPRELIVIPLFPQYASASTGTVLEEVMRLIKSWYVIPNIRMVSQFYDRSGFTELYTKKISQNILQQFDHVLFSFHGLPERQVDKVYQNGLCADKNCEHEITHENQFCYKATCYETARTMAKKLNLKPEQYTVCFQSRLLKDPWIQPYSDHVIIEKAKAGCKKLLVFSPAFVTDCLETTVEIGLSYDELFKQHGGEKLQLVESLNDDDEWVLFLKDLIITN